MDPLSVWDFVLAAMVVLLVFVNGVSVGLLMVGRAVGRGLESGVPDEGAKEIRLRCAAARQAEGMRKEWRVVNGEWKRVDCTENELAGKG